jgi:predicted Rossmann fold flavoprotein
MAGRRRVIVVGGGAAGLLAAGSAASAGGDVLLLEKMEGVGRKLGLTGKGRCNLTNVARPEEFIARFGPQGQFLRQALYRFSSSELIDLLAGQDIGVEVERGGRVFPAAEGAPGIARALLRWARAMGARAMVRTTVDRLIIVGTRVRGVETRRSGSAEGGIGQTAHEGDAVILATGGRSYPATGSTGDGYRLAESAGHRLVPLRPSLVPLETDGDTARRLQGLSLRNVRVQVLAGRDTIGEGLGEMVFTHFGVSGPIILGLSRRVVELLGQGRDVWLSIDLKPGLDERQLNERLLRDVRTHGKRGLSSLLRGLLPGKLRPVCAELCGIPSAKACHQLSTEERGRLRRWLKGFRLRVTGHRGFEEAIVTAGGVDLRDVDPRTMESRLTAGLHFAGEILDLDADTGGFNLQAAFSTGWVAGIAAAQGTSTMKGNHG